jgi:hypothetical protein
MSRAAASNARYSAVQRFEYVDPVTYTAPDTKRVDTRFTLMGLGNELVADAEMNAVGRRVRIKNTTGGTFTMGTQLRLLTSKLTAQPTGAATNSPSAGASIVILIATAGFEVGMVVSINSNGNTDYAIITAVSGGVSITVDWLFTAHTTPTITALPAYEVTKADADGALPAEWTISADLTTGSYAWAFDNIEVSGFDTSALTVEALVYLSATAGAITTTAPTGADQIVQVVGVVKKSHATLGSILFFPGNKTILGYGTSFFQAKAVTSTQIGSGAATVGQVLTADGSGGTSWGTSASVTNYVAKSANYTVISTDVGYVIDVDASGGARTISLTAAATLGRPFAFYVRKSDSSANAVIIDPAGAETIDGSATLSLAAQGDAVYVVNTGSAWVTSARDFNRIQLTQIVQVSGLALLGNASSAPGNVGEITGANNQVAAIRGGTITFSSPENYLTKSANYTVTTSDCFKAFDVDASGGTVTLSLPAAATAAAGFCFVVRKSDSSSNAVVIDPNGAELIDGAATLSIALQYGTMRVVCTGTAWITVARTIVQASGLSVLGNASSSTGNIGEITGANNQMLGARNGALVFSAPENYLTKSANYTITQSDCFKAFDVDASGGTVTLSLPAAATAAAGFCFVVRKSDVSLNTVVIDPNGAETIDGFTTYSLLSKLETVRVVCTGSAWIIVSKTDAFAITDTTGTAITSDIYTTIYDSGVVDLAGVYFDFYNTGANSITIQFLATDPLTGIEETVPFGIVTAGTTAGDLIALATGSEVVSRFKLQAKRTSAGSSSTLKFVVRATRFD